MSGATRPPQARNGLDRLADAALDVIDELTAAELLAAITPERLGARSGYAPSSVRYQLSGRARASEPSTAEPDDGTPSPPRRWAFDREQVLLIALGALGARQRQFVEASVERYLAALDAIQQTGDLAALATAVQDDLAHFTPGASDETSATTSDRVQSIAVAAADGSMEIARLLRRQQDERLELYLPVYERALVLAGRVMRDGVTLYDAALQVNHLLEGVAQRRRFEPAVDERHVLRCVLAIFHALTRPAGAPDDLEPAAAIAQAIVDGRSHA